MPTVKLQMDAPVHATWLGQTIGTCMRMKPDRARDQNTRMKHRRKTIRALVVFAMLSALTAMAVLPAASQQWSWPWDTETTQPRTTPQPYQRRQQLERPRSRPQQNSDADSGNICLSLERRLANLANQGRDGSDERAQIRAQIGKARTTIRKLERRMDRGACWEEFFFQKTLRNTRACTSAYRQLQKARSDLQSLQARQSQSSARSAQDLQDDIIQALARNNCGRAYQQQARRQNPNTFSSFFQDNDSAGINERNRNTYRGLPFATYRTLCVRLCDGYYFPVSFSTLPNYFERDLNACQSKCAAPVGLYYHQNPGGSVDQMVSVSDNSTYKQLDTAFLYRKKFVQGCSCKTSEFVPEGVRSQQSAQTQTPPRRFSPIR